MSRMPLRSIVILILTPNSDIRHVYFEIVLLVTIVPRIFSFYERIKQYNGAC